MNYRANAVGFGDGPYEVRHAGAGYVVCFDCEETTNFMYREPESWKTEEPKEEEADKVPGSYARTIWQTIW